MRYTVLAGDQDDDPHEVARGGEIPPGNCVTAARYDEVNQAGNQGDNN